MPPFEPAGDRARWRILYDHLSTLDVGDVFTYERMGELLDLDPEAERHPIQMAMRRAAKEFARDENRATTAVPNVGYRVVAPMEHATLARRHQKKAGRSLERAHEVVTHVDLTGMDPEVRKAFGIMAQAVSMQRDFNRRMDLRQKNLEQSVKAITERADVHEERTADELAELRARLERLEKRGD